MSRTCGVIAPLIGVALLVAVLGIVYGQRSPGTYQDDDIDRFAIAQRVWDRPRDLLDRWAMPAAVIAFAVPARMAGYAGVEATTALLAALAALAVGLAAAGSGSRRPWLAAVLCAFQPLAFTLSWSGLAEPVAAALLAAALAAWYRGRPGLALGIAGFLPLARIDTAVLLVVILAAGWSRVGWRERGLALLPLFLWNLGGFLVYGEVTYVLGTSFRPLASQGPERYARDLIVALGPIVTFFFVWTLIARGSGPTTRRPGVPTLAAALAVIHLGELSLLSWEAIPIGRSVGFLRHITASGPAFALVAAWGVEDWLAGRDRRLPLVGAVVWTGIVALLLSHPLIGDTRVGKGRVEDRWVITAALTLLALVMTRIPGPARRRIPAAVAGGAVAFALLTVRPIPLDAERLAVDTAVRQLQAWGRDGSVVYTNHPWFTFLSGRNRWDTRLTPPLTRESLEQAPAGSLVLWENHYGARLYGDVPVAELRSSPDYRRIYEAQGGEVDTFRVVIFQKLR